MKIRDLGAALGDGIVTVAAAGGALDREVFRVIVPEDAADVVPGDLVMLAPNATAQDVARALVEFGARGAVAVAVKIEGPSPLPALGEAADVAIVTIDPDVAWHQALLQLSAALESSIKLGAGTADEFANDLFDLAETTAMALGGAVAIMNDFAQIIAYSSQPGHRVDGVRADGILGRRVPSNFVRIHGEVRLWPAGSVRRMEQPGTYPRLVAPVRVGEKFLGSIWLILPGDRETDTMTTTLAAAANVAAVHLMRYSSARSSSAWRVNQSSIRSRLLGGRHEPSTMESTVLTVLPQGDLAAEEELLREQLASVTGLLVSSRPGGGSAIIDGIVHALLPADERGASHAGDIADELVRRARANLQQDVAVGVSTRPIASLARQEALEAARWQAGIGPGWSSFAAVRHQLLLDRVARATRRDEIALPAVEELLAYDREHSTTYGATLLAYLEAEGNVAAAADRLRLHGNSLRYRLRRIGELFDVDFADPDARLSVWLFLRLSKSESTGA